jgi:DNA-binding YbaB/EbfC family protein
MVVAKANGRQELLSIDLEPEVVDPDDIEMLQDLIVAAVNDALKRSQEMAAEEMSKLTGGLQLPGGMKMPGMF